MTKQEAIQAMQDGHKVRHIYFMQEEYMMMTDGMIVQGYGEACDPSIFWELLTDDFWDDGYSICDEK